MIFICNSCTGSTFRYEPKAATEAGWICSSCDERPGEPPGYCPQLDAEDTAGKVMCILAQLAGGLGGPEYVYVSTGSEEASIVSAIAEACRSEDTYDQLYIIRLILEAVDQGRHSAYWRPIGIGVRAGEDPRDRCECGELATVWSSHGPRQCSECWSNRPEEPSTLSRSTRTDVPSVESRSERSAGSSGPESARSQQRNPAGGRSDCRAVP